MPKPDNINKDTNNIAPKQTQPLPFFNHLPEILACAIQQSSTPFDLDSLDCPMRVPRKRT